MSARWSTFLVWALVAASALYWGLRLFVKAPALPAQTQIASNGPPARGDLTRLFGVDAPPPSPVAEAEAPPDSRFQLIGVVATRDSAAAGEGVALIAVDGKPAKAFRVGAVVDGQTILKSVVARGAALGPREGESQVNLSLTTPPAAATGSLPGVGAPSALPQPPAQAAPAAPVGARMNALQAAQRQFQQAARPALQPLQAGPAATTPQMGPQPQPQPQAQPAPALAPRQVLPPPFPMPPQKTPLVSDRLPNG